MSAMVGPRDVSWAASRLCFCSRFSSVTTSVSHFVPFLGFSGSDAILITSSLELYLNMLFNLTKIHYIPDTTLGAKNVK